MVGTIVLAVGLIATLCNVAESSSDELKLITDLMGSYDKRERPAENSSEPLDVEFQLTLRNIIDLNESGQSLTVMVWLHYKWSDYKLQWNPSEYGGIDNVRIPADDLWVPDIHLYNSENTHLNGDNGIDAVVNHKGDVVLVLPRTLTSTCQVDLTWFPYDRQSCTMKFGSWTYDGLNLNLKLLGGAETASLDGYNSNVEWLVIDVPATRNVILYSCCPQPYIDIDYTINIERRQLYYNMNVMLPSALLTLLTVLMFTIPPDAHERLTFGGALLLATMLFQQHIGSATPASSVSIPMIAVYLNFVLILNVVTLTLSVLVLNIHHSSLSEPHWIQGSLGKMLSTICCVARPRLDSSEKMTGGVNSGGGWRFIAAVVNRFLFCVLVLVALIGSVILMKKPSY